LILAAPPCSCWVGGKTGDPKWNGKFVPLADDLFDQHLRELEQGRQKNQQQQLGMQP
jgi:hypothetical protein